jgi:ABC-type transporter Mla subunit MlaD
MKSLVRRELPEAARQLRETQDLLRDTVEQILTLLEDWANREEARAARGLVTALFEKMSFQDLAGQRLAKVEGFLKALGEAVQPPASDSRFRPRRPKPPPKTYSPGSSEKRPHRPRPEASEKSELKGPQAAGDGLGQDEVEALLADLFRQEGS